MDNRLQYIGVVDSVGMYVLFLYTIASIGAWALLHLGASHEQAMLILRYFRCSAINFSCWILGHKEDFNEWADIVGDDTWKWEGEDGVKQRFRKIENVHDELDDTQARYVSRDAMKEHSREGKVDLSFGQQWAPVDTLAMDAGLAFGVSLFSGRVKPKTDFKQMKIN